MPKVKLEYIWLDGYEPVPNLRSKTKIAELSTEPTLEEVPVWNFDGSSTRQAEGSSSDCLLQPVALFPDPARANAMLVMCEVLLPDKTPHPSNSRATITDDPDTWFGFEQGTSSTTGRFPRHVKIPGTARAWMQPVSRVITSTSSEPAGLRECGRLEEGRGSHELLGLFKCREVGSESTAALQAREARAFGMSTRTLLSPCDNLQQLRLTGLHETQ
jgi:hypothetical protein